MKSGKQFTIPRFQREYSWEHPQVNEFFDDILKQIKILNGELPTGMIFEILNAKGKSLDDLDLIKNKIFEVMKSETPTDEAKLHWKQTKENLASRGEFIDFSVFFQHYWISKYKKVTSNKLYADFIRTIKKDEDSYLLFLEDMEKASEEYMRIIIPYSNDYNNRQEFQYIPETLNNLNKLMNIKQHRIIMLGLNYARFNQKLIGEKIYKKLLKAIEYTMSLVTFSCSAAVYTPTKHIRNMTITETINEI